MKDNVSKSIDKSESTSVSPWRWTVGQIKLAALEGSFDHAIEFSGSILAKHFAALRRNMKLYRDCAFTPKNYYPSVKSWFWSNQFFNSPAFVVRSSIMFVWAPVVEGWQGATQWRLLNIVKNENRITLTT